MPRNPRLLLAQSYYHIMTRGNNLNDVFRNTEDYFQYLKLVKNYKEEHPFDLYHYCLMPNHVHLLVKTKKANDFSTFMKRLDLTYFYYYKKIYGWVGHFWQGRFKSQPVGKDAYFMQCGKYIELNPVRANLVAKLRDYPYSSYHFYAYGSPNELITEDMFYQTLGKTSSERQKEYQKLLISEAVASTYTKKVWGSNKQRYNEIKKIKYHRNI